MKNYFYLRSKAEKLFQQNSFMALFFLLAVPLVLPAQGTYPQSLIWSVPSQQINFPLPNVTINNLPSPSSTNPLVYNGQQAKYATNAMQDANGKLLFFIVDNKVYDGNGLLIGQIMDPYNVFPITGISEWCIVPVPGKCGQYYLIGGAYNPNNGNHPFPYYTILDLSLQNTNATGNSNAMGDFVINPSTHQYTAQISGGGIAGAVKFSCLHFAVTPLRTDGTRFLYINCNQTINLFQITSSGISYYNNYTYPIPDANAYSTIKAEMELIQLPTSNNYRIAVPILHEALIGAQYIDYQEIFLADFDYAAETNIKNLIFADGAPRNF